jgi:hypothetical protein
MALRIALFAVPLAAAAGLVLLLNAVDAQTGVAVATLGLVAVASGAALGYFADRLPELPWARHGRHGAATHGDRR